MIKIILSISVVAGHIFGCVYRWYKSLMWITVWVRPCFVSPFSQPLVPRENITAWMNAIGLVITALPVRKTLLTVLYHLISSHRARSPWPPPPPPLPGALLDRSPRPHRVCDQLAGTDIRDGVGRLSLRPAGLHSLPPELQRNELQLCASIGARCLASLIHRTAVSDSQVRKS